MTLSVAHRASTSSARTAFASEFISSRPFALSLSKGASTTLPFKRASTSSARTGLSFDSRTPFALSLSKGASTTLITPKKDAA
ncbi:hypothetical protein [Novosphingobium pokkalii]|uniref:Uncharacterized protein n=1 Tax=Novosphingobium pokkalii TaxID=1770194 RepID=A0ABV7V2S6_9SPHN|nr:hypothetical protein [Novosphingobium pokkalii]